MMNRIDQNAKGTISEQLRISKSDVVWTDTYWDENYRYQKRGTLFPKNKCYARFDTRVGLVYCNVMYIVGSNDLITGLLVDYYYSFQMQCNYERTQPIIRLN